MNIFKKNLCGALFFFMLLTLVLVQVSAVQSTSSAAEKGLVFLANVVGLDMTKYNTNLDSVSDVSSDSTGVLQRVKYVLEVAETKLDVIFYVKNDAIVVCNLYPLKGSLIFGQRFTNDLEAAKSMLQKYQAFSGASYIQKLRNSLDAVNELETTTMTFADVKLKVYLATTVDEFSYFAWVPRVNGVDIEPNSMRFTFLNGEFVGFQDNWNQFQVGSTTAISKEEAVKIAREAAQGYSYNVGTIIVNNFTVVDSPPPSAELSMQQRENNTLYPLWDINLYLDKMYPGMVTTIRVMLWADTSVVGSVQAISGGGDPVDVNPPASTPENSENAQSSTNIILAAGAIATLAAVSAAAIIIKKKRNK